MWFLCATFPCLCLICQPVCACICNFFFQCSSSDSSLSHHPLNWPLQWRSLGQDRSCQHLGALGKDANMGYRGQKMSTSQHYAAGKKWDLEGCKCLCIFISLRKDKEEMTTESFTNDLKSQFKRTRVFSGNILWKRVKRIFGSKTWYVLKNSRNWHSCKYNQISTIRVFRNFFHSTCHKEGHLFLLLLIFSIKGCW